ncbi:squalene synthetase-like protein [Batrachochytrium dendrobatidis]|nr:squalene synthetase-like protein [Batrachochytrium dendrobatidis]
MNTHANSQLMLDRHAEFRFQQILNGDFTQPSRSVSVEQASKISKSALKTQRKNDRRKAK